MTLVALALDVPTGDEAVETARVIGPHVDVVKIGLELYVTEGPSVIYRVHEAAGRPVFLDLKLDDIPRTVAGAARAAARLGIAWLTVHTGAGEAACRAAVDAVREATDRPPAMLGVTLLTSLGQGDAKSLGLPKDLSAVIDARARLAAAAGMDGVVCAGPDQPIVAAAAPALIRVIPAVRPEGTAAMDQVRVCTAAEAAALGATMVVVGRPVIDAADPVAAARSIRAQLWRIA